MIKKSFFIRILILLTLTSCGSKTTEPNFKSQDNASAAPQKTRVVATNSILEDLIKQIGGDKLDLHSLVGPMEDAHTYEPTPDAARKLVEAQILFENGLGFEPWLENLYINSNSNAQRFVVTRNILPLTIKTENGNEIDPHVWQDISNAIQMVKAIEEGLCKINPLHKNYYKQNATAYISLLSDLDEWALQSIENLPKERRQIITSHDSFGYFGRRYQFEIIDTVLGSLSTEVADPSAQKIAQLIEKIKSCKVPAIFTENISNSKLIEQIAKESGVKLAPALYTDALGSSNSQGDTYIKMMRYNINTFIEYLKQ